MQCCRRSRRDWRGQEGFPEVVAAEPYPEGCQPEVGAALASEAQSEPLTRWDPGVMYCSCLCLCFLFCEVGLEWPHHSAIV